MIGSFLDFIGSLFVKFLTNLPQNEFAFDTSGFRDYLGYINYFLPISSMKTAFLVWLGAIGSTLFAFLLVKFIRKAIPF